MKKTIFMLCLLFCYYQIVQAQNRSFGTLPLARVQQTGVWTEGPIDSLAYQRALGVYERLLQARGDFRYPVPIFSMKNQEKSVAYINYDAIEVTLETKAYEVCASFGEAEMDGAIAFLLGHELTHYYEKHAWREGFVYEHQDLNIGLNLDTLADAAAQETEADYLGGFLAYSAGYGFFDKGDVMMDRLYAAYQLPEQIPNYPSLSDRKAMSKRSAEKLSSLVDIFEMANWLTAVGKYSEALTYYRYLLMHYQSRETYNNVGVAALLDALQYFRESELKYSYPVELDLTSITSRGAAEENTSAQLLRQALLHFDAAISLDPDYAPAYLNKACAHALLGDSQRAHFYAAIEGKAATTRGKFPKTANDIDILLGILAANAGDTIQATTLFHAAANKGSSLAAHNLAILQNQPIPESPSARSSILQETIEDENIASLSHNLRVRLSKDVYVNPNTALFRQSRPGGQEGQSRVLIHEDPKTGTRLFFHVTNDDYTGESGRGIRIGSSYQAVLEEYGLPPKHIATPKGQLLVYSKNIFILDADNKVKRWVNYQL